MEESSQGSPRCPLCGDDGFIEIDYVVVEKTEGEKILYINCYKCGEDSYCNLYYEKIDTVSNNSGHHDDRGNEITDTETSSGYIEVEISQSEDEIYPAHNVPEINDRNMNTLEADNTQFRLQNVDDNFVGIGDVEQLLLLGDAPGPDVMQLTDINSNVIEETLSTFVASLVGQPCSECNTGTLEELDLEDIGPLFQCKHCQNLTGLDDTNNIYDILQLLEIGQFQVEPCNKCGNSDPDEFEINKEESSEFETGGQIVVVKCSKCGQSRLMDGLEVIIDDINKLNEQDHESSVGEFDDGLTAHVPLDPILETEENSDDNTDGDIPNISRSSSNTLKIQIRNTKELKPGDHIAWHRPAGYWHHALVVKISDLSETRIRVIHYGSHSNSGPSSFAARAAISEEWIDAYPSNEQLYRFEYQPGTCFPADVAILNARRRLGETRYNIFANNCEHFIRQCKTGRSESYQANNAMNNVQKCWSYISNGTFRKIMKPIGNKTLFKGSRVATVSVSGREAAGANLGRAMSSAAAGEAKRLITPGKLLGAAAIAGAEICDTAGVIRKAYNQKKNGEITKHEFIKVTIRRTSSAAGSIALMIPFMFLPHSWIGMPLAALFGRGIGGFVGRNACVLYDKKSDCVI